MMAGVQKGELAPSGPCHQCYFNQILGLGLPRWLRRLKSQPAMQETQIRSLGQEDPLEKGIATHSSFLTWKIPLTEDLAGYSPWSHKESD